MDNKTQEQLANMFSLKFEEYNTLVLKDIANVIKQFKELNYTDAHKLAQELKFQKSYIDVLDKLSRLTGQSKKEIKEVLEETAKQNLEFADTFYKAKNLETPVYGNSSTLKNMVNSVANVSEGDFSNIARSTGFRLLDEKNEVQYLNMQDTYYNVIDNCVLAVTQGMDTFDNTMRNTINQLADSGVRKIEYNNNGKEVYSQRIDTAVRRNILDSIRQISNQTQIEFGKEFNADGVEVTVHSNPAPDHQEVQGKQFSMDEYKKLLKTGKAKDYKGNIIDIRRTSKKGKVFHREIGQYNCYHTVFSIILGVSDPLYSDEELEEIIEENNRGIIIDGKEYTKYEVTQLQRRLETEIRKSKDAHIMFKTTDDKLGMLKEQKRITQLTNKYREITRKADLPNYLSDRARVSGYKRVSVKNLEQKPKNIMDNFTLSDEGILRKKDGADINKIIKNQAEKLYKQANYTKEEKEKYSSSYFGNLNFRKINDYLREGIDDDIHGIKASTMAKELNKKINNTTSTEDLILYRGVNHLSIEDVSKMKIGDIIKDKGIQSTSFNPERAYEVSQTATFFNNAPIMYEIETTKGSNMLISSKIFDNVSLQEYEVVLPSNIELKIKDIKKYKYLTLIKVKYLKK